MKIQLDGAGNELKAVEDNRKCRARVVRQGIAAGQADG